MGLAKLFLLHQQPDEAVNNTELNAERLKRFITTYRSQMENKNDRNHTLIIIHQSEIFLESSLNAENGEEAVNLKIATDLISAFSILFKNDQNSNIKRRTLADLGDQLVAIQLCIMSDKATKSISEIAPTSNLIWKTYNNIMMLKANGKSSSFMSCPKNNRSLSISQEDTLMLLDRYNSFCSKGNFQDIVDFCNESCTNGEENNFDLAIFDNKMSELEMMLKTCLIANAQNINIVHFRKSSCGNECLAGVDIRPTYIIIRLNGKHMEDLSEVTKEDTLSNMNWNRGHLVNHQSPRSCQSAQVFGQSTPVSSQSASLFHPETPKSCAKNQLKKILLSYLRLLVNTRDEIALARVLNAPNRDLHHKAFTDLRKTAQEKALPMFQTAVSFVLQVRLGGKGYAPTESCLLRKHVKGLSEFVSLMNRLQSILEDSSDSSEAVKLILTSLRRAFIKAKVPIFSSETVLECIEELQRQLLQILNNVGQIREVPKSTIVELKVVLAFKEMLEEHAIASFSEFENGEGIASSILSTPDVSSALIRLPSLSSQFRTPEEGCIETPRRVRCQEEKSNNKWANKRIIMRDMKLDERLSNGVSENNILNKRQNIDSAFAGDNDNIEESTSNIQNASWNNENGRLVTEDNFNGNISQNKCKKILGIKQNNKLATEKGQNNKKENIKRVTKKSKITKEKIKNRKIVSMVGQKQLTSFFQKKIQ